MQTQEVLIGKQFIMESEFRVRSDGPQMASQAPKMSAQVATARPAAVAPVTAAVCSRQWRVQVGEELL